MDDGFHSAPIAVAKMRSHSSPSRDGVAFVHNKYTTSRPIMFMKLVGKFPNGPLYNEVERSVV